mgnify:CR=1 FL=1
MSASVPDPVSFLSADRAEVAAVAPATVCFAPGGTRRHAVLEGVPLDGDAYVRWSQARIFDCIDLLFALGVQHVIVNVLRATQLAEIGPYREQLLGRVEAGLGSDSALEAYAQRGWRARMILGGDLPELAALDARMRDATAGHSAGTVWWYACAGIDQYWAAVLAAAAQSGARSREALVTALHGEDIPPATMLISFGKPMLVADIAPPLLCGDLQAYWYQRPGYSLTEADVRRIFYDYTFLRRTWQANKAARYGEVESQRELWERQTILGLGTRLGPFWYSNPACEPNPG